MLKKLVKSYYKLLDEKLENGTLVILIIAVLIVSASLITSTDTNAIKQTKTSILNSEYQSSIVEIDGIQYKMVLEEVNK